MKKTIFSILLIFFSLLIFSTASAQAGLLSPAKQNEYNNNINDLAVTNAGYNQTSLESLIGSIIRLVLSILGAIFLVLTFVAGNNWMQAAGNEEKAKKAKATIRNLLIGLCVILVAYALSSGMGGLLSRMLLAK